jgi:5-methylthioadenosine/S-adenosylhomocysteine deaminase
MIADGIRLGIGTDGAASNNDLNVWEEIDTAAKLHKLISKDPRVVSAQQAFEMATIGGARALHMENEIGSIEKGKRADLVIVDLDTLNQTPHYSIYSDLVYSTKAADVRTVIVEGRTVVRDGQLLTLDERRIKERARVYRLKIVESLK